MWNSINATLSNVCSSAFWDNDLTWNSPNPTLTSCFQYTTLVWLPCAFLWICFPLEIYFLRHTKALHIPFNFYNKSKLVAIAALGLMALVDTASNLFTTSRYSILLYGSVIKLFTFILFFILTRANIKCGVPSSGILFTFSLSLVFCGAPMFLTKLKLLNGSLFDDVEGEAGVVDLVAYSIYYSLTVIVFLLNCFADATPIAQIEPAGKNPYPENNASFLSRMFFAWVDTFAWKGYRNPLTNDDLWDLEYEMRTAQIVKRFESKWQKARPSPRCNATVQQQNPCENVELLEMSGRKEDMIGERTEAKKLILKPLCEIFGLRFLLGLFLVLISDGLSLVNTQILNLILVFVSEENYFQWHGCFYAFLMLVVTILERLSLSYHYHILRRAAFQVKTALVSTIYKKVMLISNGARKDFSFGQIVNLTSVDTNRFYDIMLLGTGLLSSPISMILSLYWLWTLLGPCILAGVTILLLLTIFNAIITAKIQKLQIKQMKYKDERIKLTNEMLSGIKVLKLYACEPSFEKRVAHIRDREIKILKITAYLHAGSSFVWMCTPFLISFVTFGLYTQLSEKNVLNAQLAFVSLSLFNNIKLSMRTIPPAITGILQANVAMKRINKFLNCEELDPDAVSHRHRCEPIVIERGNFSWDGRKDESPILKNINLEVEPGTLVAVVGLVGSGKSSLLSAILGEMYKHSGFVNTTGKLAYVPQQAWIQNATLRDNITLIGEVANPSLYDSVLEACALMPDLEILPGGDQIEIGEKGINLSGGQKQRISLARAVYSRADTYLLDDPLSAVDAQVGKHIFEKVIGPNGLLKEKTRVFVTHNITYLPQVDYIIVLQQGTISQFGTYEELLETGGDFANFLASHVKDDDKNVKIDKNICHGSEEMSECEWISSSENESLRIRCNTISEKKEEKTETKPTVLSSKLTDTEKAHEGNVEWKVYAFYLRAIGSFMITLTMLTNILSQVFSVASDYWLSAWSSDAKILKTDSLSKQNMYLGMYALLGAGQAVSVLTQTTSLYVGALKAAQRIHNGLLNTVLHWPSNTFDRMPSGRILNRFSSDVDVLDNVLPTNLLQFLTYAGLVLSTLFVISYNLPSFLWVLLPLGGVFYAIQRIYAATSKQLGRLESVSKSPIYSHVNDTISGAPSIRAYSMQTHFIKALEERIDLNQKSLISNSIVLRWFIGRLDLLGSLIVFIATLIAVLSRDIISSAIVGLSITYAMQVTGFFFYLLCMAANIETNIVAVERIEEYTKIEREAPWVLPNDEDKVVSKNWPSKGEIVFKGLQMRYRKDLEPVLKEISFTVNGGERIGIVGRTGAGKSSLVLSLFRIIESAGGGIFIDNVDISQLGLHTLRSRLTVIPQDPVLFSGTLRINLDPTETCSDESVWRALELANLKTYVSSLGTGLQYQIEEGGGNFSVGQRQLICLARALLRKAKILILDEATAAVDLETDDLIQTTIRKEFKDCTVLTIAHRLNTVLDYDRIMVLNRGRVAEFDSPNTLLESKQSIFYKMAVDAGLIM